MKQITTFKQIKAIIEPIPAEDFISKRYGDADTGQSCFLGHIHRKLNKSKKFLKIFAFNNPKDYFGDSMGYGARQLTAKMLKEVHDIDADGAHVNNEPNINGYTEPVIKDRLMHMIEDGIKWEKGKL